MLELLLPAPFGALLVRYEADAIRSIEFSPNGEPPPAGTRDAPGPGDSLGAEIVRQLGEYFAGTRAEFDLPLAPGGTEFQNRVWSALRRIPRGQTRSYAEVAAAIGSPRAVRAVGQANRRNRVPIVIPCHRVVAAGGALGGFAGSESGAGVAVKRWLLRHEGIDRW